MELDRSWPWGGARVALRQTSEMSKQEPGDLYEEESDFLRHSGWSTQQGRLRRLLGKPPEANPGAEAERFLIQAPVMSRSL